MSITVHERPGVYASYDVSGVAAAGTAQKIIGVAAKAAEGTANEAVYLHSYEEGLTAFGTDGDGEHMAELLRLLYANGASEVCAVAVGSNNGADDYAGAFAALAGEENIGVVICDSCSLTVQQALRESVCEASDARRERIAVVAGADEETVTALVTRAAAINSERVMLVGPQALDANGETVSGIYTAAAVAAVLAGSEDVSVPINGAALRGFSGVAERYTDGQIDTLVRGGVTPLECMAGTVSPVRGITTRTKTGGVADPTWREMTTTRIIDEVIVTVRESLHNKFTRSKNNAQTRAAIRSQVILELENKLSEEVIDGYDAVSVTADASDATMCLVDFGFTVVHGLSRIYLTAHITV